MNTNTFSTTARRGFAVVALTGLALGSAAGAANAAPGSDWDALAQCESGGDWNINSGNGFSGGLQFQKSTWDAFGGKGQPQDASRSQQIAVAENVLAGQGWGAWPACSAKLGLNGAAAPAPVQFAQSAAVQAPVAAPVAQAPVVQAPVAAPVAQAPAPVAAPVAPAAAPVAAPVAPAPAAAPVAQAPAPVAAPVAQAPVAAPVVQAPVAAPVALSGQSYTIQSGDTLSEIAQHLGVVGGWQALYAANTGTVVDPNLIYAGHLLNLPA
ncbi:LysM peptidoglycan-binding domain-containing protein [Arthrobacter echini]|uniref:LysM peptidoglycan-binding domain-containing protein n=1 Tax=Arthrobacter echini TaxID=1529066 RepID=A0A5D0XNA1_9MICC|nr:transglycosylase family protein [Arthrobacter echini]TYC97890.1 LysM peptidoglycan-binding domain-containing protein [Arthrobacter echini]